LSTPFQNRLVGTIIVAAAAIIFLPDVLNGEKRTHNESFEAMPPAPDAVNIVPIKAFPLKKLSRIPQETISDDIALDEQLNSASAPNDSSAKNATVKIAKVSKDKEFKAIDKHKKSLEHVKKSVVKATSKPKKVVHKNRSKQVANHPPKIVANDHAWVIQLGSFREQHNVDNLIKKLKKSGYTAFSKPIKTRRGNLIKVFVGPELNKVALEKKLTRLKQLTNMQGKIARFKAGK